MKVSKEWNAHAHVLRLIAAAIKNRPTTDAAEYCETLLHLADDIENDAEAYATEYEQQ